MLKSKTAQFTGALAIIAALNAAAPTSADAQTLVNKKQYEAILESAKQSQENIGEDVTKFIFGGWVERRLQVEIEKQNSKHGESYKDQEFSLFKNEAVKKNDAKDETGNDAIILAKAEMEKKLQRIVDSMTTNDVASFYLAFQNYEKSWVNLVGSKKEKTQQRIGEKWRVLAGFPVDMNIDYLVKNKHLPLNKKQQAQIKQEIEKIYEEELSNWKIKALENRKSMDKNIYESANLLALEEARQNIAKKIYEKYVKPIIEKTFKQFYSTKEDTKGKQTK